jgi:hypothetical protein
MVKIKEKTMVNKIYWLRILIIVLIFGMTVVGCRLDPTNEFVINNNTDYPITMVVFSDRVDRGGVFIKTDNSAIPAHSKKSYAISTSDNNVYVSVTVNGTIVNCSKRFENKDWGYTVITNVNLDFDLRGSGIFELN